MRYLTLLVMLVLGIGTLSGQPGPKISKVNSEFQEEIKEIKAEIKELEADLKDALKDDPEYAEELTQEIANLKSQLKLLEGTTQILDSSSEKLTDNQQQGKIAFEEDDFDAENKFYVPKYNAPRINSVPKAILTDADLASFLKSTSSSVEAMTPEFSNWASKEYQKLLPHNPDPADMGFLATGAWMSGRQSFALFLMGRACASGPNIADNLNNYSVMLSAMGADHKALPILMKLNAEFPGNSVILNNIGQAWFGLGELDIAEKYLDSTLQIYPRHPQANMTKAILAHHKGDIRRCGTHLRESLREAYSEDKEQMLIEIGESVNEEDFNIDWDETPKADELGLRKFLPLIPPYYYKAVEADLAEAQWTAFRNAIQAEIDNLELLTPQHQEKRQNEWQQFYADLASGKKRVSPMAIKYTLKNITYGKRNEALLDKSLARIKEMERISRILDPYYEKVNSIKGSSEAELCEAITELMSKGNELWGSFQNDGNLHQVILDYEEWAEIHRYYNTTGDDDYQADLHELRLNFLFWLKNLHHVHITGCKEKPKSPYKGGPLPFFEDSHCSSVASMDVGLASFEINCHYMSWHGKLPLGIFEISGGTTEDILTGEFVKGTVDVTAGVKLGETGQFGSLNSKFKYMPVGVEVKAYAGVGFEFDKSGLSDVILKTGFKAKAGAAISEYKGVNKDTFKDTFSKLPGNTPINTMVESVVPTGAGAEFRYSFNNGPSLHLKGALSAIQ